MKKTVFLVDGEIEINLSGLYTFVHYYYHPETNRKVIIPGMSHFGDRLYFEKVDRILNNCDFVLYEYISDDGPMPGGESVNLSRLFIENPEVAFLSAIGAYFSKGAKVLNLSGEGQIFDYQKPNWIYGDMESSDEENQQSEGKLALALQTVSYQTKKGVVDYISKAIVKMEGDRFTKRDLGKGLAFVLSNPRISEIFSGILGDERGRHVFKNFDLLIREKDPGIIGIKFGAGHISFQRRLLEERGYIRRTRKKLCSIKF